MILALIFLLESWLWEVTGALVARFIAALPFERFKLWFGNLIQHFSPLATLALFAIPVLILLPLKVVALWLLAKGFVLGGITAILSAKLVGLGVSSFLFALCKPKLLQLRFIAWLYHHCLYWRDRAHALVAPYTRVIRRLMKRLRPETGFSRKLLAKLRRKMHKLRHPTQDK